MFYLCRLTTRYLQISFDLQRQLIKHFDLEVLREWSQAEKVIELSNHSTIRMGSINQVDSVVGRSYGFNYI